MIDTALHFGNSLHISIKFYINIDTYLQNYKERKFKFWKLVSKRKENYIQSVFVAHYEK